MKKLALLVLTASLLSACGGSGSSSPTTSLPAGQYDGSFLGADDGWAGTVNVTVSAGGTVNGTVEDNYRPNGTIQGSATTREVDLVFLYPVEGGLPFGRHCRGRLARQPDGSWRGTLQEDHGDVTTPVQFQIAPVP